VRLDHLLSKEHWSSSVARGCSWSWVGSRSGCHCLTVRVGVTLWVERRPSRCSWLVVASTARGVRLVGVEGVAGRGCRGSRTLLGPEATLVGVWSCRVTGLQTGSWSLLWWVWVLVGVAGGVWLLFENCTVDASIFVLGFCGLKFIRAQGGCLGTRSRRRT
jgi:hypothetical protein